MKCRTGREGPVAHVPPMRTRESAATNGMRRRHSPRAPLIAAHLPAAHRADQRMFQSLTDYAGRTGGRPRHGNVPRMSRQDHTARRMRREGAGKRKNPAPAFSGGTTGCRPRKKMGPGEKKTRGEFGGIWRKSFWMLDRPRKGLSSESAYIIDSKVRDDLVAARPLDRRHGLLNGERARNLSQLTAKKGVMAKWRLVDR